MAETIADFVAKLGFKVDKGEEARFNSMLGNLAKMAAGVAASLVAASATIQAAVIKVASSLDELHFAAQRTNTTVASIKSLTYALQQTAGLSGEAAAAIEGVAAAIRTDPGVEQQLNNRFGIITREGGKLRDVSKIMDDIHDKAAGKPYYQSRQIAEGLGIHDEKTWNAFVTMWPEIKARQAELLKTYKELGVDPDRAAAASNKLMTSFREMMMTLGALSERIVQDLYPILNRWLKAISEWVKEHRQDIVDAIEGVMHVVERLSEDFGKLVEAMKPVASLFGDMAKTIFGDSKDTLTGALELLLGYMITRWVGGMLLGIARVAAGFNLLTVAAFLAAMGLAALARNPTGQSAVPTADGILPGVPSQGGSLMQPGDDGGAVTRRGWSGLGGWLKEKLGFGGMKDGKSSSPRTRGSSSTHGANTNGVDPKLLAAAEAANKDSPYDARISSGYRPGDHRLHGAGDALDFELYDRKTGKKLPNYQDPEAVAAYKAHAELVRKKYIEGGGDPNDLRWGGYFGGGKGKYGAFDLMHIDKGGARGMPMGGGDWEHGFTPEMLKTWGLDPKINDKVSALMNPTPLGGSVSRSATLTQRTDITVLGSSDPAGSAAALGSKQSRVGSDLLRNARTAFT